MKTAVLHLIKSFFMIGIMLCATVSAQTVTEYENAGGIYRYRIVDTSCLLSTALGTLDCVCVEASAKSRIGKTRLTAYYNEKYGFVKFDYTNIDGSKIVIDLQSQPSITY